MIKDIYTNITKVVNENSTVHLDFEHPDGIEYSILDYPVSVLLQIESTSGFVKEAYYKVLDGAVDDANLQALVNGLNSKSLSREELLKNLASSNEAKTKKTKLNWDK